RQRLRQRHMVRACGGANGSLRHVPPQFFVSGTIEKRRGLSSAAGECEARAFDFRSVQFLGGNMRLKTIRAVAFCSTALLAATVTVDAAPSSATTTYNGIVQDYFAAQWKAHPSSATPTGVHTYDDKLDDVSAAAVAKDIARLKDTVAKLRAVDGAK